MKVRILFAAVVMGLVHLDTLAQTQTNDVEHLKAVTVRAEGGDASAQCELGLAYC